MKIRNKNTGQIFEVIDGTRYPSFFEEVKEVEMVEPKVELAEPEEVKTEEVKPKDTTKKKKTTKKGKKNGASK